MPLGKLCKEKKVETGLTSAKIAVLSDVPENTIINIVNGRSLSPSVYNVGPICRVLGISLDEFFGITVKGMDQHEIDRIHVGYEKHKKELQAALDLYAQQAGHQDEVISRQDERIKELNARVESQKEAISWLRGLAICLAVVGVLAASAAFMMLRHILSSL